MHMLDQVIRYIMAHRKSWVAGKEEGQLVHVGRMSLFRSYTYRVHLFQEWGNGGGQHTIHHITHLGGEEGEERERRGKRERGGGRGRDKGKGNRREEEIREGGAELSY